MVLIDDLSISTLPARACEQVFPGESRPRRVSIGGPPGRKSEDVAVDLSQKAYIKQLKRYHIHSANFFLMRITVKLFGTLSDLFSDYDFEKGLEVDLPEGSKVADLLARLNISDERGGTVLMDSRILPKDERLTPGSQVLIFQALNGG